MAPAKPVKSRKKFFTAEEANRALPLVGQIVKDIVAQWKVVSNLEQRLSVISRRSPKERLGDMYDEEVSRSQHTLEEERATLQAYIDELKGLGVELKGFDGLCDFPSMRDGREIYLCWRLGEQEVLHWHELHSGFGGRQPLRAEMTTRKGTRT